MSELARVHLTISGHVQGVAYRANAANIAQALGVWGWVRNLDDGRVEIVAEGPVDAVERLLAWARRGPPRARVDDVRIVRSTPTGEMEGFVVRR